MKSADRALVGSVSALGCVLLLWAAPATAAVGISPGYVEVRLDKGRPAGRFLISNLGSTQERYRIKAIHFTYSAEGGLEQTPTGEHSLAQWIHFNPRELMIAPRTQRAVRFAIVSRGPLKDGEYWGAMELESLQTREVTTQDADGKAVKLKLLATIMVPIFGTVGDVQYEGDVKEVKLTGRTSGPHLEVLVANTGTGRLGARGAYEIRSASGKLIEKGKVGRAYVLRGAERRFTKKVEADQPEGRYIVRVSYTAPHLKKPLEREVQVDWERPPKSESTTQPASSSQPASRPRTQPREGD